MARYDITRLRELEATLAKRGFDVVKDDGKGDLVCAQVYHNGKKVGEVIGTLVEYFVYLKGFVDGSNAPSSKK